MNRGISMVELLVAMTVMTMTVITSLLAAGTIPGIIADAKSAATATRNDSDRLQKSEGSVVEALEDEHIVRRSADAVWTSLRGVVHTLELSSIVAVSTSTQPAACDPFTSGDWAHPRLVHSYQLNSRGLIPSLPGTYSISALAILPDALEISIGSTSQLSAATMLSFSLAGTSTPKLLGAFDNASTSRIGNSAVAVDNDFAYAGNAFGSGSALTCRSGVSCAQVNVYSVHAPSQLISSLALATSSDPYAYLADGSSAPASAVTRYNSRLYLGLQKTLRGDEFNIIDASDPGHLIWLGGYPIGRTVTSITVRGERAYVTTDDPHRELMVFDVHDPHHPTLSASWDAPGPATFGYGSASTVFGNIIRLGRTYTPSGPEFELLNLSTTSITESEHIDSGTTTDPESVRALLTQDRLTFLLLTHRLDVLDTHDFPRARILASYPIPPNSRSVTLACRNNQVYVARNSSDGTGYLDILQGS